MNDVKNFFQFLPSEQKKWQENGKKNYCLILAQFPHILSFFVFISMKFFVFPVGKFLRRISEMKNGKILTKKHNIDNIQVFPPTVFNRIEIACMFRREFWGKCFRLCIIKTSKMKLNMNQV